MPAQQVSRATNRADQSCQPVSILNDMFCFRNIVQLLLTHEASTNIVDGKGSSPLHLAAWTGNVDIVRLLLCHGPSVPNVNLLVSVRSWAVQVETIIQCV